MVNADCGQDMVRKTRKMRIQPLLRYKKKTVKITTDIYKNMNTCYMQFEPKIIKDPPWLVATLKKQKKYNDAASQIIYVQSFHSEDKNQATFYHFISGLGFVHFWIAPSTSSAFRP